MESNTVRRLLQTTSGSYASLHSQSAYAGSNGGAYENTCISQWQGRRQVVRGGLGMRRITTWNEASIGARFWEWLVRKVLEEGHFLFRNKTLEAPITPLTAKMSIIFGVASGIKLSIAHEATKIWSESDSITAIAWSQGRGYSAADYLAAAQSKIGVTRIRPEQFNDEFLEHLSDDKGHQDEIQVIEALYHVVCVIIESLYHVVSSRPSYNPKTM
ncbi:hypothetical protein QJS10_CPB04g01301 [Acorus calamus]|uniref:Uncharacterized protein n=1 Tax=Acorus calamus TaxID=4465 RepID=A0AAV9F2I7_ACOCL|nr:hypothetical protein QJS10_CPB04g01301 [Acorus calamus]